MTVFGAARSCRPLPALIIDLGLWGVEAQDSVNYTCNNGVVFARCGRGKAVGIWLLNKKQKRVLEIFKKSVYLFIFFIFLKERETKKSSRLSFQDILACDAGHEGVVKRAV